MKTLAKTIDAIANKVGMFGIIAFLIIAVAITNVLVALETLGAAIP